jgi:hypothetical protein
LPSQNDASIDISPIKVLFFKRPDYERKHV